MIFFYLAEISKLTWFLADSMGLEHTLEKTDIWIMECCLGSTGVGISGLRASDTFLQEIIDGPRGVPFPGGFVTDVQGSGY